MADNLLPGRYAVGAASVDAGGTVVTPAGATWTDNVWGDDLFFLPSQPLVPPQRVESVNEDGELVLAYPWPGAAATEEPYEVRYVGIIERSTAQSRRVLEQLGDVKAWYDIIVTDDASRLALESPSSPLRAGYRVLVRDDGVIWAKETAGYGDWIGPVEFKGDMGNKGWSPVHGIVADGARRVWQLVEWVGGQGATPAGAGKYVGLTGLVDDIANATDVRGPAGNIAGVTSFWQSRITVDADASAARAGLELVKQTSATDATAGSLLTVGAFGTGKTVALTTPDLNSVRPSGRYYCSSPTNGPGGNGWLDVFDLDANTAYHEFTDATGVVHSRVRSAGVWSIWQPRSELYLHVREEQAQNVAGGAASSGANDRILNAVKFNNIPGASVASNRITLPEGVYKVEIKAPAYAIDSFKIALLDYGTGAILLEGTNAFSWSTTPSAVTFGELTGILTIPAGGRNMIVRLYAAVAKSINGLGVPLNRTGLVEVYTDVMIKRIR